MQDQWWWNKAADVQHYADTHNAKTFFSSLKTVFGPSALDSAPLLSSDGKTLNKDQESLSGPRQLTQTPWIRSPNSPYEFRSQNPLPSRSRRRSTRQSSAEHRERMASLGDLQGSGAQCSLSGRRRWYQTTSATPCSSHSIKKGK